MKNFTKLFLLRALILGFLFFNTKVVSQNEPFNCVENAYLFQMNDIYAIDLASGISTLVATDVTPGNINAAAYNPTDGYMWGYLSTPSNTIVRIGNDFSVTTYYIPELTTGSKYVGDISSNGIYYFKASGSTYYKVDLNPSSPTYTQYLSTESLSLSLNVHDWAFNAVDGQLYSVEQATNILYRINPSNGVVTSLGEVPILAGMNYTYGAVYFDSDGAFYVSSNQTGTIYIIDQVQNLTGSNSISSNLFAFGPSSSSNDGARCPTASVPKEDCSNGIDDDGDGLVDCDDPSCSGFGSCPVMDAVSGGNEGGLESNNRLVDLIKKRNFNRVKSNYSFDYTNAERLTKSSNYCVRRDANADFQLIDFIPLGSMDEDEVLETTPNDLLGITNATEVYAADYLKNNKLIASVLALKTDNGVYEHTKYICDRLIGAELLNVSTIEINDQPFIRSIIKNADGSIEYVLSLSAKLTQNETNFGIESHWNLDKYESNVSFYNFQIWTNSLDNLFYMGTELLHLIDVQRPITTYNNSPAPTVFVRKGKYMNGVLQLDIVNTNETEQVIFDAGIRTSETNAVNLVSNPILLQNNTISSVSITTGNLFDVGFRIGDGIHTPDDLFLSDGPWGVDDAASSTQINSFLVVPQTTSYENDAFGIERNIILSANTSEYVAVYRGLTPRFKTVDLSDYESFKFTAKGTGKMMITLVKGSINTWESQFRTTIDLTNNLETYALPLSSFTSTLGGTLELNDIKTLVFTMISENGSLVTKEMQIENVRFSKEKVKIYSLEDLEEVSLYPNPMDNASVIQFVSLQAEKVTLSIYNQLGALVKQLHVNTVVGKNELIIDKDNLNTGLYFCNLVSSSYEYKTSKLLVK
ncbi:conserved exported hypothetical protein [Flavobacterium sp. 9AF]|uniref:DUF6923 family protein n=1 Tax=Flavobacterium sp. 9AF TaxID=2653142 RepID=UPI0012F43944|nr:T9SS type A sorting domain-containing protein [Flavobacterium sp. 9AF]VXB67080.1 conserved exported hypothetical protein [Flavobacterium sp. 9AF]